MTVTVSGRAFGRALAYALIACPKPDDAAKLSHVVFTDRRLIASDGERFHIGRLHDDAERFPRPIAVARDSAKLLLLWIECAERAAKYEGGGCFVHVDGLDVKIAYGEKAIEHRLTECAVGYIPDDWEEPVPLDAPIVENSPPVLRADHFLAAAKFGRDNARITMRATGPKDWVRLDVTVASSPVATALLLPPNRHAAQLAAHEPLLEKVTPGPKRGQSVLDLQLDLLPPTPPQAIKIGDREWNVTGISADPSTLIKSGPCAHRTDAEPCHVCTDVEITKARADAEEQAAKVVGIGEAKKKRGRKPKKPKGEVRPDPEDEGEITGMVTDDGPDDDGGEE